MHQRTISCHLSAIICSLFLFAACEKVALDEISPETETPQTEVTTENLTLHVSQLQQSLCECTHLNFAIYDMEGKRLMQKNQLLGDNSFGTVGLQLDKGTYQLVVLAHSSTKNPTMTNLSKIQFNNSIGYTDTYLYYTTLAVTDEHQTVNLTLYHIASLCRFVISDHIPEGVTQMRFQYTGGSGHLNAQTGLGVTNSKQVVTRQVQAGQLYAVFDLYTFLHQQEGTIDLTATALDAAGNVCYEWEFEIPMAQDRITWLNGLFFTDEDNPDLWLITPNVEFYNRWSQEVFYTY